jgi:hypothetical protein
MDAMQTLSRVFGRNHASGPEPTRGKGRRVPACESLEGRQLLNAAWTPHGFAGTNGAAGQGFSPPAHVGAFNMNGSAKGGHALNLHGTPKGTGAQGFAGHTLTQPSAQLKTDLQTLQADEKALQAEIPASLTDAVKADQAVIQKASPSLTHSQMKAGASGSVNTATLAADLTKAGVSSSQASTIVTDLQNLKNASTTTDPTLQAKIAVDQAAIVKDGGPSLPAKGMGMHGKM